MSIKAEVSATISALDEAVPTGHDPMFMLVALQAIGDALRARVDVPSRLRAWVLTGGDTPVLEALRALTDETGTWVVHGEALSFSILRRDLAKSVTTALDWRAIVIATSEELAAVRRVLDAALERYDVELAERLDRVYVEALLGERASLRGRWAKEKQS